jgi:regulatory protein
LFCYAFHFLFEDILKEEKPIKLTPQQALLKAAHYCAYQERSHKEVIEKLNEWGIWGIEAQEILLKLIEQNYVNEERYAIAFAGGKFRVKHWGKVKISQALKLQQVSDYCINKALAQISDNEYEETLALLIEKKWDQTRDNNSFARKNKVAKYALSKGFEGELVWEQLKKYGK